MIRRRSSPRAPSQRNIYVSAVSGVGNEIDDKLTCRPTRGPVKLSRFQEACSDDLPPEGWFSTKGATLGRPRAAAILDRNLARRALHDYCALSTWTQHLDSAAPRWVLLTRGICAEIEDFMASTEDQGLVACVDTQCIVFFEIRQLSCACHKFNGSRTLVEPILKRRMFQGKT